MAFSSGATLGMTKGRWMTAAQIGVGSIKTVKLLLPKNKLDYEQLDSEWFHHFQVNTLNASIGGSLAGLMLSVLLTWKRGRIFAIPCIVTSILGGLVGGTAGCDIFSPTVALLCGGIGEESSKQNKRSTKSDPSGDLRWSIGNCGPISS